MFSLRRLMCAVCACLAGFGAQYALERLLANLLTAALPAPSPLPLAYGFAVGLALLAGRDGIIGALTEDLIDEPGQPTRDALDQVLQFFRDKLVTPSG